MEIVPVVDEGLGNSSYLIGLGDGGALVVDPFRDPAPYLRLAAQRGWRIRAAAETHLHADFVSGSRELAAAGAEVLASRVAPLAYPARLLGDGDELDLGGLTVRALATPGHTPEHLAYLLLDGEAPVALFSGGTLIVGGLARTDLLDPDHTEALTRAAYRSVRERLAALPDDLPVYPTHGAGSFCASGADSRRTTTLGDERAANPVFLAEDEDRFVHAFLDGLGSYPPYFLELRAVNQAGPALYALRSPPLRPLTVAQVEWLVAHGAELVDVRDVAAFAAGHVPGALSNALRPQFATWLGWLVERERLLVFVADEHTDRHALVRAAIGIGYEHLAGELDGGVAAWRGAGKPLATIPLVEATDAGAARQPLDVRQRAEWAEAHVPGAQHAELGSLAETAGHLEAAPLLAYCGHGERAMTAASLLARQGHPDVAALAGGPEALARATGRPLEPAR